MKSTIEWKTTLLWVTVFSIAMGYLESAVVIYLREIYYPGGFDFPLGPLNGEIVMAEIGRELATLVMLLSLGILAGKNRAQRFAYFIYSFAIWDIFYYIFLKILIDWPDSLMTWDVLFMLPLIWVGPVISPLIVSATMIVLAFIILIIKSSGLPLVINRYTWSFFIIGSLILILSFVWDYSAYILENITIKELFTASDHKDLGEIANGFKPKKFNWTLFVIAELTISAGIFLILVSRNKKK